ncbi:MAG: HupE/UreJ family protein [Chthoniobacterales bacterium]
MVIPHQAFAAQLAVTAVALFALARTAFAHDPGISSAELTAGEQQVHAVLTFSDRDIAALGGEQGIDALAGRAAVLEIGDIAHPPEVATAHTEQNNVVFDLTFAVPSGTEQLTFRSTLLPRLPFGHRQAFAVHDESGAEIARRLLSARHDAAVFPITRATHARDRGREFFEFLMLGIRHILTGYDHLLFLFGLLIVTRAPRAALVLITCFTIAHSITLALSTFGLVELPSRFVEATIAASILYVGIENMIRRDAALRWRWLLTLGFGLIHGLGFASVLREMGIAKTGAAAVVPLVAFNSGVEVGQLAVAALVLPIFWKLRQRPAFARVGIPACSIAVAAAGAFWLLQRTLFS